MTGIDGLGYESMKISSFRKLQIVYFENINFESNQNRIIRDLTRNVELSRITTGSIEIALEALLSRINAGSYGNWLEMRNEFLK